MNPVFIPRFSQGLVWKAIGYKTNYRKLMSVFYPAILKDCALLRGSYSCPNKKSNMKSEYENVDAEESTYIPGSEVLPLLLLRQHTTYRWSKLSHVPSGAKVIQLRVLDRRITRSPPLGGVGWVDSHVGKEGSPLDYRSAVELKTAIVSHHRQTIRHWSGWANNLADVGDQICCDHREVLGTMWDTAQHFPMLWGNPETQVPFGEGRSQRKDSWEVRSQKTPRNLQPRLY